MQDLIEQFSSFVSLRKTAQPHLERVLDEALAALENGAGSFALAFELNLLASRIRHDSADHALLIQVADSLRSAAFSSRDGAGYLCRTHERHARAG